MTGRFNEVVDIFFRTERSELRAKLAATNLSGSVCTDLEFVNVVLSRFGWAFPPTKATVEFTNTSLESPQAANPYRLVSRMPHAPFGFSRLDLRPNLGPCI